MQSHREVYHGKTFGDDLAASGHPREVMARVGVVTLDRMGVCFADHMLGGGQHGAVGRPVVSKVYPSSACYAVVELAEGGSITMTDDPGEYSPCTTVQRFPDPTFVFFDPI
jgi:hypothetical protein